MRRRRFYSILINIKTSSKSTNNPASPSLVRPRLRCLRWQSPSPSPPSLPPGPSPGPRSPKDLMYKIWFAKFNLQNLNLPNSIYKIWICQIQFTKFEFAKFNSQNSNLPNLIYKIWICQIQFTKFKFDKFNLQNSNLTNSGLLGFLTKNY